MEGQCPVKVGRGKKGKYDYTWYKKRRFWRVGTFKEKGTDSGSRLTYRRGTKTKKTHTSNQSGSGKTNFSLRGRSWGAHHGMKPI